MGNDNDDNDKNKGVTTEEKTTNKNDEPEAPKYELQFFLKAGEIGEYGKSLIYNEGTEFEKNIIAYYVPAAKYIVENAGNYPTQVNVYSDEIVVNSSSLKEPKDGKAILLKVGEEKELVVPVGYHIEIGEPTYIQLKKVDDKYSFYKEIETYYRLGRIAGDFWIACFSIVENNGTTDLYLSNCEFQVIGEDGILLATTNSTKIGPIIIKPGERGVFYSETTFSHALDQKYDFNIIPTFEIEESKIDCVRFEVSDVNILEDTYKTIHVQGKILNNTDKDHEFYYVVTFLYDANDKIIGIISDFPDKFKSGQTISFDSTNASSLNNIKKSDIARSETFAFPLYING